MTNKPSNPGHVFLTGPMGAGKSTIGIPLSERLERTFYDMDQMIVEKTGRSIPEIFADDGECNFRALEGQMLADLCAGKEPAVIATGGGVVLSVPNCKRITSSGTAIWLDAPPEVAAERISGDANRPLLLGVDTLQKARELDYTRRPLYASIAAHTVRTDQLAPTDAVEDILEFLGCP
ncbi:MAG: shikimate kinase [Mariprofundaceae bacterium]|nr:shikimate kinase [Mariprofundaceae bacterium]